MKLKTRLFVWAFAVAVVLLPSLSVQAVPWCDYSCNVWPLPCCTRPCWNNYWTTCGDEGYWCNETCRSEQSDKARADGTAASGDAALLRVLQPGGCAATPVVSASLLSPTS